jgi:hypothetical protein
MSDLASYEALDDEVGLSDSFLFQSGLVWSREWIWTNECCELYISRACSCTLALEILLDTSYEIRLRIS